MNSEKNNMKHCGLVLAKYHKDGLSATKVLAKSAVANLIGKRIANLARLHFRAYVRVFRRRRIQVEVQIATAVKPLPSQQDFERFVSAALHGVQSPVEICIRLVDPDEMAWLNKQYRAKDGITNILSFPYERDIEKQDYLLGDLVVCPAVIVEEALQQQIPVATHWAHIVVHGCLHLLGYDHQTEETAAVMESLEAEILKRHIMSF